jgi:putative radical SAM enzyme (TIGR03279 family)
MRESLYFKDDDSRLSFLHGNYVTLTNMTDEDIDRIIKMHISPINISVHTTNPELRCKMMSNKRAGYVLEYIKRLADAGITIEAQIVLCRGLNDGEELDRTMHDLAAMYPAVQSVSVVPAGLTKYREGLYPLEPFDREECREVLRQVNSFAQKCYDFYGSRVIFCSDEFYIKAGLPMPPEDFYEGYPQLDNGVGMVTSMKTEFMREMEYIDDYKKDFTLKHKSLATGRAAYPLIAHMARMLCEAVEGLIVDVYLIENYFFG